MKCVVLAAGYATRLYPITENFPKPLLEVKGKTILDWLLDDIDKIEEINEYVVISNHRYIEHFKKWAENKKLSSPVTVIDDGSVDNEYRLGAVMDIDFAVSSLKLDDDLLVIAGDNVLDFSFKSFAEYFKKKNSTCIMRYFEENKEKIKKSAAAVINESGRVLEMTEKPENPQSNWCVPPFYIYKKCDIPYVRKAIESGCKTDAPGSFVAWLSSQTTVHAMEMPGERYDVGNIESYNFVKENYKGITN